MLRNRLTSVLGTTVAASAAVVAVGAVVAPIGPRAASVLAMVIAAAALTAVAAGGRSRVAAVVARASEALRDRIAAAARARLEMRTRAETAGRFREEFVAAVRHELKTPLNAILGFTQVLLDEIDGPLTPQQREDVVAIRQAGLYLSELVEAVLAEWEPARATPMPLAPVDLAALVREVARLLEGQAAAKARNGH